MRKPLKVNYFSWLRERTGLEQEELVLPDSVETIGALIGYLSTRNAAYAHAFQNSKIIRCAVNQEFADPSWPVHPGDEVAFFPPVTGG